MMRYLAFFLFIIVYLPGYGQLTGCKDLWEGAASDRQYVIGGWVDGTHAYRMFLCRKGDEVRGYYEMINAKKNTDVEGFFKGDSIFLAEYSKNQRVLGMIRGILAGTVFTADLSSPSGVYSGKMEGLTVGSWAEAKTPEPMEDPAIIVYSGTANPDESIVLSFPNDYSCKGIFNNTNMKNTFYLSGKRPDNIERQYTLTSFTLPPSGAKLTCMLNGEILTQSTLPGKTYTMTADKVIPFGLMEKSDRLASYEIHYPIIGIKGKENELTKCVNDIRNDFDSLFDIHLKNNHGEEHVFTRAGTLAAWFEPSYVSEHWLCGHFIIQNNDNNASRIIPVNYNYKKNKLVNIEDLISLPKSIGDGWNTIIAMQPGANEFSTKNASFGAPVLAYRGILLSTDYDRIFDRQLYQTDKKIKGIRWKWWKPEYWMIKIQQF